MNAMLEPRIVTARTHRSLPGAHGCADRVSRITPSSQGGLVLATIVSPSVYAVIGMTVGSASDLFAQRGDACFANAPDLLEPVSRRQLGVRINPGAQHLLVQRSLIGADLIRGDSLFVQKPTDWLARRVHCASHVNAVAPERYVAMRLEQEGQIILF